MNNEDKQLAGFSRFAGRAADAVGTPWAFGLAMLTIAGWLISGPRFRFSDGWQLVMNSWTNFVTFAMVFLIQHTQNRDSKAVNLKLDELIRAVRPAEADLINIERLSNEELEALKQRYEQVRKTLEARKRQ